MADLTDIDREFPPAYRTRFRTLQSLAPPRVARAAGWLVLVAIVTAGSVLWWTPWIQTAAGYGQIVELNPSGRPQPVTAFVTGRIKRWYVREADRVQEGDPLVELEDIDPQLVNRLRAELDSMRAEAKAARLAAETSRLDADRQVRLFEKGLAARRDMEAAKVRYEELAARQAAAEAKIAPMEVRLARLSTQVIKAPRAGVVLNLVGAAGATLVREGDVLATLAPVTDRRAVEIYVSGLDAPLITVGRPARLMFEGWPAVQFSGWPAIAIGTFAGVVQSVDPLVAENGRFRVLLTETEDEPWPSDRFLRLGGKARAWIMLGEVRLGYEFWRQLNGFPPEPFGVADTMPDSGVK
jgi:multidrug efflux pump subunit AcrA (membrane-fusion protein)